MDFVLIFEIPSGESADTDFKISPVCFFRL